MKIFTKWFYKHWLLARKEWDNESCVASTEYHGNSPKIGRSRDFRSRGMTFTMYPASGGNVVEYESYDEKTERTEGKLHIIPADADLGAGLAHIITLEYLRR